MKTIVSALFAGVVWIVGATPTATVVSATAVDGGTALEVTYSLDADAIVTLSVATNAAGDAFLGEDRVTALSGDVNRKVLATSGSSVRTLRWDCARENVSLAGTVPSVVLTAWSLDQPPDILAFHVLGGETVRFYTSVAALPGGLDDARYRTAFVVMRKIPAKGVSFTRGASKTAANTQANESTFTVSMTNDYYIGIYPFTGGQYCTLTGVKGWHYNCENFAPETAMETPACGVSYNALRGASPAIDWPTTGHAVAADSVLGTLRVKTGLTGLDLPTESEWEYAARCGSGDVLWNGSLTLARLDVYEWCRNNSPVHPNLTSYRYMSPVGRRQANGWGLYDLLGNCPEWCLDWIESDTSRSYAPADADEARQGPSASSTGTRALRGRFCADGYDQFSLSQRRGLDPSTTTVAENSAYGFRLVCPADFR